VIDPVSVYDTAQFSGFWEDDCFSLCNLESLSPYLGKVVKYTCDGGWSWDYVLLGDCVYDKEQRLVGLRCYPEQSLWQRWQIGRELLLTPQLFGTDTGFVSQTRFELVPYEEFQDKQFSCLTENGYLTKEQESRPLRGGIVARAPLTIVRSCFEGVSLQISVIFEKTVFSPCLPIEPSPSLIQDVGRAVCYTWNVTTDSSGALLVEGTEAKVQKIWWEVMRHKTPPQIDVARAACVKREEVSAFISSVLSKQGVLEKEQKAFVAYWQTRLDHEAPDAPYVLIDMVDPSTHLPPMFVVSDTSFELKRIFFLFEPTHSSDSGLFPNQYLESLSPRFIGPSAVIDLGGQYTEASQEQLELWDDAQFHKVFMNQHIY
jgi:hypothetical protein